MSSSSFHFTAYKSRRSHFKACDACYRKKIKCDGKSPKCGWCNRHEIECTFARISSPCKRSPGQKRRLEREQQLSDRMEKLENIFENYLSKPEAQNSNVGSEGSAAPSPRSAGLSPKQNTSNDMAVSSNPSSNNDIALSDSTTYICNGLNLLSPQGKSWIQFKTGQVNALAEFNSFDPPWKSYRPPICPTIQRTASSPQLPEKEIVLNILQQYEQNSLSSAFPVILIPEFEKTIAEAYKSEFPETNRQACSQACVSAFLAFASLFIPQEPSIVGKELGSERSSDSARTMLPFLLQEMGVEPFQTIVMLSIYGLFTGNLQEACFTNALAARIAFSMGANRNHESEVSEWTRKARDGCPVSHTRNLFWLTYILDKELCMQTGQPPSINDDCCDLDLPDEYMKQLYGGSLVVELPPRVLFPCDLRLAIIKSKAYSRLYSADAIRKTGSELLQGIRKLDQLLEEWRRSLPQGLRPSMNFKKQQNVQHGTDMRIVMLQLAYYNCISFIHEASCRCQISPGGDLMVVKGVDSSMTLSMEASRSLLLYYRSIHSLLEPQSFWITLYYPVSALITLFKGIVLQPDRQQSFEDLDFFTRGKLWRHTDLGNYLFGDLQSHVRRLEIFIRDMWLLGSIVIKKFSGYD